MSSTTAFENLTDYDFTLKRINNVDAFTFLDDDVVDTCRRHSAKDLTKHLKKYVLSFCLSLERRILMILH